MLLTGGIPCEPGDVLCNALTVIIFVVVVGGVLRWLIREWREP